MLVHTQGFSTGTEPTGSSIKEFSSVKYIFSDPQIQSALFVTSVSQSEDSVSKTNIPNTLITKTPSFNILISKEAITHTQNSLISTPNTLIKETQLHNTLDKNTPLSSSLNSEAPIIQIGSEPKNKDIKNIKLFSSRKIRPLPIKKA